ncbi:hypothetical protein BC826DRAFT_408218 [Russula brevipes]|nr:hypothetical protein BC826DRAFT_408218 [Russula brevipes]
MGPIQHPCSPKASRRLDRARACTRSTRPVDAPRNRACPGKTVRAMLSAGWPALLPALLPAFFFLLTTNLSDPLFGDVLGALQALARAAGFLALPAPRDAFLTTLAKTHFPHALLPRSKNRRRRSLLWSGPLVSPSPSPLVVLWPGSLVALWLRPLVVLWPGPFISPPSPALWPGRLPRLPVPSSPRPAIWHALAVLWPVPSSSSGPVPSCGTETNGARYGRPPAHAPPSIPTCHSQNASICRACAFCSGLGRAQVRLSHVGFGRRFQFCAKSGKARHSLGWVEDLGSPLGESWMRRWEVRWAMKKTTLGGQTSSRNYRLTLRCRCRRALVL